MAPTSPGMNVCSLVCAADHMNMFAVPLESRLFCGFAEDFDD